MTVNNDHFYIKQVLQGDEKAFAELVERYQHMVYTLCMKMCGQQAMAEEVAQDVFIKCYRSLSTYNGKAQFSTWLYRITYNACLDALKSRKRHASEELDQAVNLQDEEVLPHESLEISDRKEIVKKAIDQLPKEDRVIVMLFYFEEMSLKEIAKVMDMTDNHVKVKLFRCREKLAALLEDKLSII